MILIYIWDMCVLWFQPYEINCKTKTNLVDMFGISMIPYFAVIISANFTPTHAISFDFVGTTCSNLQCSFDGFQSWTNSMCVCNCPSGLDSNTNCTSLEVESMMWLFLTRILFTKYFNNSLLWKHVTSFKSSLCSLRKFELYLHLLWQGMN